MSAILVPVLWTARGPRCLVIGWFGAGAILSGAGSVETGVEVPPKWEADAVSSVLLSVVELKNGEGNEGVKLWTTK